MKKKVILSVIFIVIVMGISAQEFGAKAVVNADSFTLEEMLMYAIQDEYLALNEYEVLVDKLGADRPFSNIIKSEKTHISLLEELYNIYNLEIPKVDTSDHLYIPKNLSEAGQVGVDAEVLNIAMYKKFLSKEIPNDVREVFEILKSGSENHLKAFERQVNK